VREVDPAALSLEQIGELDPHRRLELAIVVGRIAGLQRHAQRLLGAGQVV
jgi:hypothetical protein